MGNVKHALSVEQTSMRCHHAQRSRTECVLHARLCLHARTTRIERVARAARLSVRSAKPAWNQGSTVWDAVVLIKDIVRHVKTARPDR